MNNPIRFVLVATLSFASVCTSALALDTDNLSIGSSAISLEPDSETSPIGKPFGTQGQTFLTIGGGVASDISDATDSNLHIAYSSFFVQDVEIIGELGGWYFSQRGDDAFGVNLSLIFRWHFLNKNTWSLYADAGIGMLAATSDVPDGGTPVDFMPRFGGGATFRINDSGSRLITGIRWHHVSNARVLGEARNPSRDAVMLYTGIMIPF